MVKITETSLSLWVRIKIKRIRFKIKRLKSFTQKERNEKEIPLVVGAKIRRNGPKNRLLFIFGQ